MERARRGCLLPYLKKCYIPVTHLLEKTTEWEGPVQVGVKDLTEFGENTDISSLCRLSGERAYLRQLRRNV